MSHVLSPREFLESVLERLKPGGLLILDEKDVLQPRHFYSDGPFDTGRLHQYHLTRRTLESYALAAGFEIVACEIDPKRKSIQRHIHLVARKPETGPVVRDSPWLREPGPQVDTTLRRLRWLQRTWALQRARAGAGRSLRRLFRAGG